MPKRSAGKLNAKHFNLLKILQKNGNLTATDLGKMLGVGSSTVKKWIKRLTDAGIINGYQAIINLENALSKKHPRNDGWALGTEAVLAFIILSGQTGNPDETALVDEMAKHPNVVAAWAVTGTISYIVHVLARNHDEVTGIIGQLCKEHKLLKRETEYVLRPVIKPFVGYDLRLLTHAAATEHNSEFETKPDEESKKI